MSARRGRSRSPARPPLLAFVLLAGAAAALAAVAFAVSVTRPPALDPETLCPLAASAPAAHTLILVDATDPLEPRHKRALEALAAAEARRLGRGGRLTLLSLDAARPREPKRLFSRCHPGDGSEVNPLIGNPKQAASRYDEGFAEPLAAAVRKAESPRGSAPRSPILETVRAASADPGFAAATPRRFVLVSDLLEHDAPGPSAYRGDPAPAALRAEGLAGASVRVLRLDRPGHDASQLTAQTRIWDQVFAQSGVAEVSYDPAP